MLPSVVGTTAVASAHVYIVEGLSNAGAPGAKCTYLLTGMYEIPADAPRTRFCIPDLVLEPDLLHIATSTVTNQFCN